MKNNFLSVIFGCILALLLMEILLRTAPYFIPQNEYKIDTEAYRVLCMGDSSTYGTGASARDQFSYPAILEALLSKANSKKIQVINLGLPGINSSQALIRFASHIEAIKPDLVLVCIGINDPWNMEQSSVLNFYEGNFIQRTLLRMVLCIQKLKTVRFLKLLFISRKEGCKEPVPEFTIKTISKNMTFMPDKEGFNHALIKSLKYNLNEFNRIARKFKSKIFFMEYHAPGWGNPEIIIHRLYRELSLGFIPAFDFFQVLDNMNVPIRGNDQWHLNDLGYTLLAKMICICIRGKVPVEVPLFNLNSEEIKQDSQSRSQNHDIR